MKMNTDTWTRIEDAGANMPVEVAADGYRAAYAAAMTREADGSYTLPDEESDALSAHITVTLDGGEYVEIREYYDRHPDDDRIVRVQDEFDSARCEATGVWKIHASVPFKVMVRPHSKGYAIWEFRHSA